MIPTAVIVTRGDVDLASALGGIPDEWPVVIWDNSKRDRDLKVFGYFAALDEVQTEYAYTVADDAVVDAQRVVDEWTPEDADRILLNVADGDTPWISFGGVFRKDLPEQAFERYLAQHPFDDDLLLWCEVIFCELTPWRNVDIGKVDLPWCTDPHRMWMQSSHYENQRRIRVRCSEMKVNA